MPNKDDFLKEIQRQLNDAKSRGANYIDLNAGDVHRTVGGYPTINRMPVCCDSMYELMKSDDEIISAPPKGKGASLTIRYYL